MVGVVGVLVVSLGSRPLTFGVLVAVVGPLVGSPRVAGVEVTELAVFAGVLAVALAGVLATPAIGGPRLRLAIRLASVLGVGVVAPVLVAVLIHGPFQRPDPRFSTGLVETVLFTGLLLGVVVASGPGLPFSQTLMVRVALLTGGLTLVAWVLEGRPAQFAGLANHKNGAGVSLLCMAILLRLVRDAGGLAVQPKAKNESRERYWFAVSLIVLACFVTGSRAALACCLVVSIPWTVSRRMARLLALPVLPVVAPTLYLWIYSQEALANSMDRLFESITGLKFFSGRQRIWIEGLESIGSKLTLGHGYHYQEFYSQKTLNLHSLLMAKTFQVGLIGGLLFLAVLIWVSLTVLRGVRPPVTNAAALGLAAIWIHQTFEVNLGLGGPPAGAAFAVVLGLLLRLTVLERAGSGSPARVRKPLGPSGRGSHAVRG